MKKKIISLFISAALCISVLPVAVLADTTYTLQAGKELKIEAEDIDTEGTELASSLYSGGVSMRYSTLETTFDVKETGQYQLLVVWGAPTAAARTKVLIDGTEKFSERFDAYWGGGQSTTVTLTQGPHTMKVVRNSTSQDTLVDYIKILPVPTVTSSQSCTLEAEDYRIGWEKARYFTTSEESVVGSLFNNNNTNPDASQFNTTINVADEGDYTVSLRTGWYYQNNSQNFKPDDITVNIAGGTPSSFAAGYPSTGKWDKPTSWSSHETGLSLTSPVTVHLTAGEHNIQFKLPFRAIVDYVVIEPVPAPAVSATEGNKTQDGNKYMTFDATPANVEAADVTDCGFAFVNTNEIVDGNPIVWKQCTKRENGTFGTAIMQDPDASSTTIHAIPFIVGDSFAVLGAAVEAAFN